MSVGADAFFGYFGVSAALVFASNPFHHYVRSTFPQIWELLMELPAQALVLELSVSWNLNLSWDRLSQSSWLVFWEFTAWLFPLSSAKKVKESAFEPIFNLICIESCLRLIQQVSGHFSYDRWIVLWLELNGNLIAKNSNYLTWS